MKVFKLVNRVLGILLVIFFTSLFVMGVFTSNSITSGVVIKHLLHSIIFLFALIIAWKWDLLGGLIYCLLGLILWVMIGLQMQTFFVIIMPVLIIGGLNILFSVLNKRPKSDDQNNIE